jgi:hypothetical protein
LRPNTGQARFVRALNIGFIAAFVASTASATTYYVDDSIPTSGSGLFDFSNAKKTIPEALAIAVSGDVVRVGQGIYKAGTSGAAFVVELEPGVSIQGGYAGFGAPNPNLHSYFFQTLITGDFLGNDNPSIPSSYNDNAASVVYIPPGVQPPGTFPYTGANEANLDGCHITAARSQGGIRTDGFAFPAVSAVIRECNILTNVSSNGGGVFVGDNAEIVLRQCQILDNHVTQEGGGIAIDGGAATLLDCLVFANTANGDGGGIKCLLGSPGSLTVVSSQVSANIAGATSPGAGGGLSCKGGGSTITLINSVFNNNQSSNLGAAIEIAAAGSTFQMTNCTVRNNTATGGSGGGLYFSQTTTSNSFIKNSIFWDNAAPSSPEISDIHGTLPVTFSDVEQTSGTYPSANNSNINDLPNFVSSGNHQLACGSPCINAGNNTISPLIPTDTNDVDEDSVTSEPTPDRALDYRIVLTVDMGAYERQWSVCLPEDVAPVPCGDLVVNINDLLMVINRWGPCPADGPCLGNIDNGVPNTVNIDDLLAVINAWGQTCPGYQGGGAGSMPQSIQDCSDMCDEGNPGDPDAWAICFQRCVNGLCQAQLIQCD